MRISFEHLHFSAKFSPLAFATIATIMGISLESRAINGAAAVGCLAFCCALAFFFWRKRWQHAASVAALAAFTCAGFTLAVLEEQGIASNRLKTLYAESAIGSDSPSEVRGWLADEPERGPGYADLVIEAAELTYEQQTHTASGAIEARLLLDSPEKRTAFEARALRRGTRIRVVAFLQRSQRFQNPGVVDYTEYLDRKGYDLTAVVKSPLLIDVLGQESVFFPRLVLSRVKTWIEDRLDASLDARSAAMVKAVLLGNRNYLDDDTIGKFRAGGTFHLLVISGVHLAFLASLLFLALAAVVKNRRLRVAIVIALIWGYAVMVGLQPPVARAALTITIFLVGELIFREARALNTLAAAALVLLALKPSNLWDPGFQLSFAAVALIVLLPGPVYERMRSIGSWQPAPGSPYPPASRRWVRTLAESLFWNQSEFEREQSESPVKFNMKKSPAARWLCALRVQRPARWVAAGLITSALVQIGLLPLTISYFNRIPIAGIWLNILTSVLLALQLAVSLIATFTRSFVPPLAMVCRSVSSALTAAVTAGASPVIGTVFSARVPHLSGRWLSVYVVYYLACAVLVITLARWSPLALSAPPPLEKTRWRRLPGWPGRHPAWSASIVIALLVVFSYRPPRFDQPLAGHLRLSFLDVGQGDAALVEFPGGSTMLIDGGGRPRVAPENDDAEVGRAGAQIGERVVSRFLWQKGIRRIDYVLATHGDADHTQGLGEVAENFQIGKAFLGPLPANDPEIDDLVSRLRARNIPLEFLTRGSKIPGVNADASVLWPPDFSPPHEESVNNDSVVLLIRFGEKSILMTGDIEGSSEHSISGLADDLRADVLKVPHHGSRTSSTPEFLGRVQPEFSVISVGQRSVFGHPHKEAIERLQRLGTKLFVTGCAGTVTADTDGRDIVVTSYSASSRCR